jgi:hypothetical protein
LITKSVLTVALIRFDMMLLDPFKEEFNLPAFPAKFRVRQGIKPRIVGNEPVNNIHSMVFIYNNTEWIGVMLSRLISDKPDHFIADNPSLKDNRTESFNGRFHVVFCPGNEERPVSMKEIKQAEAIQVSHIFFAVSSRLYIKFVRDPDMMDISRAKTVFP